MKFSLRYLPFILALSAALPALADDQQKAEKQVLDNGMYFKPELSGENRKRKVELSGDREIVELETNERWQELDGAM